MTEWLRRAGRGRLPDGTAVVWSVAEGRRGRRWREVRHQADGSVLSTLLLETDRHDRFAHTELATAAGLLTLHPEGDGTLHGNTITAAGVEHLRGLRWAEDAVVLIEGSMVADAVMARTPGDGGVGIAIDLALTCRPLVEGWRPPALRIDARGLPILADGEEWPLEDSEAGGEG